MKKVKSRDGKSGGRGEAAAAASAGSPLEGADGKCGFAVGRRWIGSDLWEREAGGKLT